MDTVSALSLRLIINSIYKSYYEINQVISSISVANKRGKSHQTIFIANQRVDTNDPHLQLFVRHCQQYHSLGCTTNIDYQIELVSLSSLRLLLAHLSLLCSNLFKSGLRYLWLDDVLNHEDLLFSIVVDHEDSQKREIKMHLLQYVLPIL